VAQQLEHCTGFFRAVVLNPTGAHISGLCFPWGVASRPCVLGHRDLRHRAESGVIGAEAKKSKSASNVCEYTMKNANISTELYAPCL